MSGLGDIPIRVEPAAPATPATTGTIGGGVNAILSEIAARLERVARGDGPDAIDMRTLPISEDEREQLRRALGVGEVSITLRTDGESTIRETAIRGVWWNQFRDIDGQLIAEFIEVAPVPGILPVPADELRKGAQQLRAGKRQ